MHPLLFEIPGLGAEVHSYAFFVALALVVGWMVSVRFAKQDALPADRLGTAYVVAAATALLGSRALWLMFHPQANHGLGSFVQLQAGGLALGGGLVLGIIASWAMTMVQRVPFFAWFDCLAPAVLIGVALERFGAFLAGAGFGRLVAPSHPLGVRFPLDSPVYAYQSQQLQGLNFPPGSSMPVHPTQLYAVALAVVGVGMALYLRRVRSFSGQVGLFVFGWYVLSRMAIVDPFRVDGTPAVVGPITSGQISAMVLIACTVAVYVVRSHAASQAPEQLRQWEGGPWTPSESDTPEPAPKKKKKKKKRG